MLFMPHGYCYLWHIDLVLLHIVSDAAIAFSYYSIPVSLYVFVKKRTDLPFNWIFLLFAGFIVACGTTHVMDIWNLWHSDYWTSGQIKLITAILSIGTAIALHKLIPKALALPSPEQLKQANQALELQIAQNRQAQEELEKYRDHLEEVVVSRTEDLRNSHKKLEKALSQLQSNNQAKDQFIAVLSHELRTPLNAMSGALKLLSPTVNDEQQNEKLEIISSGVKQQSIIVDSLVVASSLLLNQMVLHSKPTDLKELINNAIASLQLAIKTKSITLIVNLDSNLPLINVDPLRMQQAIYNVLSNAVKYNTRRGQIEVKATRTKNAIELMIADTGEGIEPNFIPYIFDYFKQADSSTSRVYGGLGLGLAIARQVIELHGGTIHAYSLGKSFGATFTINIPINSAPN